MSLEKNFKTKRFFRCFRYGSRSLLVVCLLWTSFFVANTFRRISEDWTTIAHSSERNRKIIETTLESEPAIPPLITALCDESGEWIFEHAQWNYHQKIISEIELKKEWEQQPKNIPHITDSLTPEEDSFIKLVNMLNIPVPFLNTLNRTEKDNFRFYNLSGNGTCFRLTTCVLQETERVAEGKLALQIDETKWLCVYFSPIPSKQHQQITNNFPPCPESGQVVCLKTDGYGNIRIAVFDTDIDGEQLNTYWKNHGWTLSAADNISETFFNVHCRKQHQTIYVTGKKENGRIVSLILLSPETHSPQSLSTFINLKPLTPLRSSQ
ncbi:MAG: hypothetical protein LBE12_13620 [Planctomycetaceae bacterium]|jgi:hypothetical protein|nr:hypothetical protein [Planctomycetaceae bacterium]